MREKSVCFLYFFCDKIENKNDFVTEVVTKQKIKLNLSQLL